MPASNMSVQPRAIDSEGRLIERPSMKQDGHPDHNMPAPEHNGVELLKEGMKGRWSYSQENDTAREASDWNK